MKYTLGLALASSLAFAVPAVAVVYQAAGLVIEVADGAPLGIVALRATPDGPALFLGPETVETTWELVMIDATGAEFRVDPLSRSVGGQVRIADDAMTMVWQAVEVPGGTVKVACSFGAAPASDCRRGFPVVYGRIEVKNESTCQLRAVQFPRLALVPEPEPAAKATLVFPRAHGRSWRNPFDAPRGYLVGTAEPAGHTGGMEMQFGTLYDDAGNGLYWAFYDGEGYHKRVVYDNADRGRIDLKLEHIPEDCLTPGQDYASPYPVAIAAYHGDWWDAARMYREWALQQKWCARGPIEMRADVPDWVKQADVWIRGDARRYAAQFEADFAYALQDIIGGTFGVQLYGWYQVDGVPNWFATLGWPMVEAYPEMIAQAKARGIHHTPYVNSLQTDLADPSCPEGVRGAFLLNASGDPVRWSDEAEEYTLCAATDIWREMLVQACERLVREGNASGVYLDQLGGQCGYPCYASDHGHPVGGGHYATDSLRAICQAIREAMGKHDPQAALSGEVQHEMLLDVTDHRLQHYNWWPGWVNLWPAVYGDYSIDYGRTLSFTQSADSEGNLPSPIEFYGPTGNTFISGLAFGRIWPTGNPHNLITSPGNEEERDYFQACLNLRRAGRKWFEFGYLQRPVTVLTEIPTVPMKDPKGRDSAIDALLHSAWIASDGSLAFAFTNVSEEPLRVRWLADLLRYEIAPAEVYCVQRVLPDGTRRSVAKLETSKLERTETLAPHAVILYEVTMGAY
ncbi:MAG: DUF6259 domain-containing protein [Armatimonadota bacterium]